MIFRMKTLLHKRVILIVAFIIFVIGHTINVYADIIINILAVNGTNQTKEKKISQYLPKELTRDDILDTAGLNVDYDVEKGAFYVYGTVRLGPKQTKTFKIRVRDVWKINKKEINDIKVQIEESLKRIKGTKFYKVGQIKKESMFHQLDYILQEQEKYADDIEKRIDNYRIYSKEVERIRNNALSVAYWRAKLPSKEKRKTINFVVEIENPYNVPYKIDKRYYLPSEVKPEHFIDTFGFDVRYDAKRGQPYLIKEEELKPKEKKKYVFEIIDIWHIPQESIENLKDRTRYAYKLLEHTEYADSAKYLVNDIKKNLEAIEKSQEKKRNVNEHISAYRVNLKRFNRAKKDVETLESVLNAVRAELERSKLKNVLNRIRMFRGIADVVRSVFKKPAENTAWKLITGIVILVGVLTVIHFAIWAKRSKDVKIEDEEEEDEKEE